MTICTGKIQKRPKNISGIMTKCDQKDFSKIWTWFWTQVESDYEPNLEPYSEPYFEPDLEPERQHYLELFGTFSDYLSQKILSE